MALGALITQNSLPAPALGGASRVIVHEQLGATTTYEIHYPVDIEDGDLSYLSEGGLDPGSVLGVQVLAGTTGTTPSCLVKGPVYGQRIHLEHRGAGSTLVVQGADSTITMAREYQSQQWANVTDGEAVMAILGTYGLIPDVGTTRTRHLETKHTLVQRASDLDFIRRLARRNGFQFWISCNPLGIETAHFKRPSLVDPASVDLSINQEGNSLESFDILWDAERPTSVAGIQLDLGMKTPMPGLLPLSPQTGLGALNLQTITRDVRTIEVVAPTDDVGDMLSRSEGALIEADWFISARCSTSLHQTGGQLIHAHELVNIVGAGSRHSGKYLVAGVRHIIDGIAHQMEIDLIRNAWNPTVPGLGLV